MPLVVMLEDFEGFSPRALEDFVTSCRYCQTRLTLCAPAESSVFPVVHAHVLPPFF